MNFGAITPLFSKAIQAAIPESQLTVRQWADTYRYVSSERSALPGKWQTSVVPYLAEPMECVSRPDVQEIIFVASSQVGKTELCNNIVGHYMHADPSPILYVAEVEDKARAWSVECLAPMIRDTEVLREIVADARERDSGNTIIGKVFPGGHLAIGWATSPATLSSRPRRVVIQDERDAYKPTKEGDPVKLADKRAVTFRERKKLVKVSSPRDRLEPPPGSPPDFPRLSPIEWEYELSDKRKYYVPCPECGEYQVLQWKSVRWDEDPSEAYYVCVNGCLIEHESKADMLVAGEWRAEMPFRGRAGFWINELYSPFSTWGEMAVAFLEAKKNPASLKVFVNTSLAEGWDYYHAEIEVGDIQDRAEEFGEMLPDDVLLLVAGTDVQRDRLECEIVGVGLEEETWSIGHHVLSGDPSRPFVWEELKALLLREYPYEVPISEHDGATSIKSVKVLAACIDSGGHHTEHVYRFVRANRGRRWYAVKGANTPGKPIVSRPTLQGKPPVKLFAVGTETAKDILAARLALKEPGPGFCHFPTDRPEEYFKQLRSEHPVTKLTKGVAVRRWEKIKPGSRNEALDLRVYAMAALAILRPNLEKFAAARLRGHVFQPTAEEQAAVVRENVIAAAMNEKESFVAGTRRNGRGGRGGRGGGFVSNW
jgi:phage terminase large subunit GpA-like protein